MYIILLLRVARWGFYGVEVLGVLQGVLGNRKVIKPIKGFLGF
jgi:hypothetical protein